MHKNDKTAFITIVILLLVIVGFLYNITSNIRKEPNPGRPKEVIMGDRYQANLPKLKKQYKTYRTPLVVSKSFIDNLSIQFLDQDELNTVWNENVVGDRKGKRVHAFAMIYKNSCSIFIPEPENINNGWNDEHMLREIGHEVLHCLGATHERF